MKSKYTGLVIAAVFAALLGAGTWYVNAIYLPHAQMRKAQELQTTAAEKQDPGTDYDYTIPVDESAIKIEEPTQQAEPHAQEDTAAGGGQEPADTQEPSEQGEEEPTEIYITRDWHDGGESHVSTTPPVIEEPKPSTAVTPTQQKPAQSKPSTQPVQTEPEPAPEPEPEPVEPKDTDTLADLLPQRGETRVVNGQTLVWYDGWGWIPETAAQQIENGELDADTGASETQQEQQTEGQG